MTDTPPARPVTRRAFGLWLGRAACTAALGATAVRVLLAPKEEGDDTPAPPRHGWQIDPAKCVFCETCATACVRTPSAAKAVNDQRLCSNCVVCYGHITNHKAPSDRIDEQPKVCPLNAVTRVCFSGGLDGYYIYDIDAAKCNGCAKCARECNRYGSKSMFMAIRPDLCLHCSDCALARACPEGAVQRVSLDSIAALRPDNPMPNPITPAGGIRKPSP